jgi:hypothetical protein
MPNEKIKGGYYIKARVIKDKPIQKMPPYVREIWDYCLREANHCCKYYGPYLVKRGQLFRTYKDIREDLCWYIGYRKMMYNENHTKRAMKALRSALMIDTTKVPGGVLITILNYDFYQDPKNYEGTNECTNESTYKKPMANQGRTTIYNKNEKNEKNVKKDISAFSNAEDCGDFYTTKKKRRLMGKRLETFNRFWVCFDYKKGRAEAADSWFDIPHLTDSLVNEICIAAEREAKLRPGLIQAGKIPKMAQGWLSGRRWEDEDNTKKLEGTGSNKAILKAFETEEKFND